MHMCLLSMGAAHPAMALEGGLYRTSAMGDQSACSGTTCSEPCPVPASIYHSMVWHKDTNSALRLSRKLVRTRHVDLSPLGIQEVLSQIKCFNPGSSSIKQTARYRNLKMERNNNPKSLWLGVASAISFSQRFGLLLLFFPRSLS